MKAPDICLSVNQWTLLNIPFNKCQYIYVLMMSCAGSRGRDGLDGATGSSGSRGSTGATGGAGPGGRTGATGKCPVMYITQHHLTSLSITWHHILGHHTTRLSSVCIL